MTNAVIVGYARSAFTLARKGALASVRPDDLATQVIKGLVAKSGVKPSDVDDLIMGCAFPEGEQGFNIARMVGLMADLPRSVGGMTVNRYCGSSMSAVHIAAGSICAGAGDAFICAGVESMTRVPMMGFNPMPNAAFAERMPSAYMSMGETAENVATRWQIPRGEQEDFAVQSQAKTAAAQSAGKFKDEIIDVNGVSEDGCLRTGTTNEALAELKPAFSRSGSVTAGTSSPLTDGASATLVCSENYAKANGLQVMARIRSIAVAGCGPEIMGIGPVVASQKALARAGLAAKDMDITELNEAFASQALACIRDLGLDPEKVNIDGGAIALGHPLGATGARITGKAASLLRRQGGQFALASQCIGGGQGIATVLEAV
ncbi:acetyl-CoA acetyltransferase family protein [Roseibium hamelinense]|uniref:Beta-ketothiolase n=1 Tax=Roseibium hamelinense TaxID=150831 RepID=A0A562SDF2_9HYPH|nr:thiolase family protein [Roseibium hamelinense]MTI42166.1 thiolase family protein [Roseibium hamelinense]TWI78726.1 acetyl-CoA acetyltransferase family protein [Roseibium hamelinense]